MSKKLVYVVFFVLVNIGLMSCTSYYIPIDSFKEQFSGIDSTNLRLVIVKGPAGDMTKYLANPIDDIKCVDKHNNPMELKNSPSIEIRFTEKDSKRTVFYFDRVFIIQDSLIVGDMSRFIPRKKVIPINNVRLIEVQDGHKNFKYVE